AAVGERAGRSTEGGGACQGERRKGQQLHEAHFLVSRGCDRPRGPRSIVGSRVRPLRLKKYFSDAVMQTRESRTKLANMPTRFDAIVVGTGQAGPALAARLSGAGMKVAVIEKDKFGGTCVNDGCTPTKTMVASAYAAHMASRGEDYGFQIGNQPRVDMKRVKARKDGVVANSSGGVEKWMRGLKGGAVFNGHARFLDPNTVEVGSEKIQGDRIFLDVGGRPLVPKLKGIERVPYLTNQSLMEVDFVPEHLIVVGGSYIGLEFGQMFRRFGSRVTIV